MLKGLLVLGSWMALELKSTAVSVHIGIEGTSMHSNRSHDSWKEVLQGSILKRNDFRTLKTQMSHNIDHK